MNCKACNNEIPDGSVFCNWCGERQVKQRKKKDEIKVPKPRQLPSGKWNIELKKEGQSATFDTAEECTAWAKALRAGFIETQEKIPKKTVGAAIDEYIESRSNIISPSTLRTYKHIRKYRFKPLMAKEASALTLSDIQNAVNLEAAEIKPKTLRNAWGLVRSAIKPYAAIDMDGVLLPAKQPRSVTVYDKADIKKLFAAVAGTDIEIAVLLAACLGLRRSEILGLSYEDIDRKNGTVYVHCARVPNENNELVEKSTKTFKSTRTLPCPDFITDKIPDGKGYIYTGHSQNYLLERLKQICKASGLPDITLHGLRHTNASVMLALNIPDKYAMERGGWSNDQTMKNIYQHTLESERKKADKSINKFFEKLSKT